MMIEINTNNMASTTTMINSSSSTSQDKESPNKEKENNQQEPIIITTNCPAWKLYENPFYNNNNNNQNKNNSNYHQGIGKKSINQCLQIPLSARKLAASFWELAFFTNKSSSTAMITGPEEDNEIAELRAQLESERRARKKLESANKRLERKCEELARELSLERSEIEEERKMLRTCEVLREERVQMKLADAKIALEEKLSKLDDEFEARLLLGFRSKTSPSSGGFFTGKFRQFGVDSIESLRSTVSNYSMPVFQQRKMVSPETENPHIKRGIKGFVEFPRVVRAIGAKNKQWGNKLECQKAQLRILLKQKSPLRSSNNSLIM